MVYKQKLIYRREEVVIYDANENEHDKKYEL